VAFPDFKANGVQNTSSSFDGSGVEGSPQQELTFQTPRTFMGLKEEFCTPKGIIFLSEMIGNSASLELQPT